MICALRPTFMKSTPGLVKSQSQFLQDKNEKCIFEITMHSDIAFKLLSEIDFLHLDMTQLNLGDPKTKFLRPFLSAVRRPPKKIFS